MRAPLLLSFIALLLLPAQASAGLQTFGSDLSQPATLVQEHQADTAFWPTHLHGGDDPLVPVAGQIKEVRIKGMALRRPDSRPAGSPGGETMFHVQALDGIRFRITSQAFVMPATGDPQQVTTFRPANFCVQPGERIAFNTVGGYDGIGAQPVNGQYLAASPYPMGTPLQIFARTAPAATGYYEQANGTDNGEAMAAAGSGPREAGQGFVSAGSLDGQELLMQMTLATGDDRSYECGGPNTYRPADADRPARSGTPPRPVFQKARIPQQRLRFSSKYKSALSLICAAGPGRCRGKLTVHAGRPSKVVASASFNLAGKSAGRVSLRLSRAGRRLWNRAGRRLPARMTAVTGAGGPNYTDARPVVLGKRGR